MAGIWIGIWSRDILLPFSLSSHFLPELSYDIVCKGGGVSTAEERRFVALHAAVLKACLNWQMVLT